MVCSYATCMGTVSLHLMRVGDIMAELVSKQKNVSEDKYLFICGQIQVC